MPEVSPQLSSGSRSAHSAMLRCPQCRWQGERFADHIEGAQVACPCCGILRRDMQCIACIERAYPRRKYILARCLEVARGGVSGYLRRKFLRVTSINITPGAGEVYGDVRSLRFKDGVFDLIVCMDVLEHLDDDQSACRELLRVLKPKGRAFFHSPLYARTGPASAPNACGLPGYHHNERGEATVKVFRYYSGESLSALLTGAGFSVSEVSSAVLPALVHQEILYEGVKA
jgi:SAM-dependent methyltransferase